MVWGFFRNILEVGMWLIGYMLGGKIDGVLGVGEEEGGESKGESWVKFVDAF